MVNVLTVALVYLAFFQELVASSVTLSPAFLDYGSAVIILVFALIIAIRFVFVWHG
jgi:hypothetical protein